MRAQVSYPIHPSRSAYFEQGKLMKNNHFFVVKILQFGVELIPTPAKKLNLLVNFSCAVKSTANYRKIWLFKGGKE
jgi:hypothetical protein